jgi:NADH-quinone oxidoreductase subunit F
MKWSFMKPGDGKPHYLCCNADESEPGTVQGPRDHALDAARPGRGVALGAHAIYADTAYIYVRGEYTEPVAGSRRRCATRTRRASSATTRWAPGASSGARAPRRRRVHLRRGDGAHELAGGAPRQPAHQAALPGGGRPVRAADDDQQRRDARRRAAHRQQRRGVVQAVRPPDNPKSTGTKLFSVCGNVARPGTTRSRWASRSASSSGTSAEARRTGARSRP